MDYRYYPLHEGVYPVVEMSISANGKEIELPAIVDTGAQNSLLSSQYAMAIGLDIYKGNLRNFTNVNGLSLTAYGHQVQVRIQEEVFTAELFFPELQLRRCLLGRDIMEKMQIGLNESVSSLFLF